MSILLSIAFNLFTIMSSASGGPNYHCTISTSTTFYSFYSFSVHWGGPELTWALCTQVQFRAMPIWNTTIPIQKDLPPSLLIDSSVGWSLVFVFGFRLNFLASMSSDRRGILLSPDVSLQGKRPWMMFAFYSFQPFHFQCLVTVVILLSSRCLFCFQLLSTFSLSCIGASGEPNSHMHNFHIHNTSFSVHWGGPELTWLIYLVFIHLFTKNDPPQASFRLIPSLLL